MSYSAFPESFLMFLLGIVYLFVSAKSRKKTGRGAQIFCVVLLVMYCVVLLWLTLAGRNATHVRSLQLVPFRSYLQVLQVYNSFDMFRQIIDNVLVFFPLGFLLPAAFNRPHTGKTYAGVIFAGACLSALIEALQYAMSIGYSEIDDVIGDTIGVIIGCGIFALSGKLECKNGALTLRKGWFACLLPLLVFAAAVWLAWCYRELILYS